jgi:hypothetical protein
MHHHSPQQPLPPKSVNGPAETYTTQDLNDLNQKIQNRFIREVVKPYSNGIRKPMHIPPSQYTIPKSSEVFSSSSPPPPPPLPFIGSNRQGQGQQRRIVHVPPQYTPITPHMQQACPLDFRFQEKIEQKNTVNIACLDIHQHVGNCPVCSKLHRPYNSILMVIIVVLLLIILFLSKKLFKM